MKAEFMPAAWLTAHNFEIDALPVLLDKMEEDGALPQHIELMVDCADEAAYYRAVGVYQMFPINVITRMQFLLGDSRQHADTVLKMIRNTRGRLDKARPFRQRTAKTETRRRHAGVAVEHALAACGACLMVVHQLPEKQCPQARFTMQRMAVRLREGHSNILKFKEVLDVRAARGLEVGVVIPSKEEVESDGTLEDIEGGLLMPGPQHEMGDPGA